MLIFLAVSFFDLPRLVTARPVRDKPAQNSFLPAGAAFPVETIDCNQWVVIQPLRSRAAIEFACRGVKLAKKTLFRGLGTEFA